MNKNKLIHDIGSKLIKDISPRRKWDHLVLACRIEQDEPQMNGFAFTKDGKHVPVAPTDFDIPDLLLELRNSMAASDKKAPWLACLIRIERDSGEIDFEFEYDKAERWVITPGNVEQRALELSPFKK